MIKMIVILFVMIFLNINCKENKEEKNVSQDKFVIPKVFLKEDFVDELRNWISYVATNQDPLHWDELCYTVEFYVDSVTDKKMKNDTIVIFSYYTSTHDYFGLKGVTQFDNIYVAIVDNNNVGTKYYNLKTLENMPMDFFRSGLVVAQARLVDFFKLENGKLVRKHKF